MPLLAQRITANVRRYADGEELHRPRRRRRRLLTCRRTSELDAADPRRAARRRRPPGRLRRARRSAPRRSTTWSASTGAAGGAGRRRALARLADAGLVVAGADGVARRARRRLPAGGPDGAGPAAAATSTPSSPADVRKVFEAFVRDGGCVQIPTGARQAAGRSSTGWPRSSSRACGTPERQVNAILRRRHADTAVAAALPRRRGVPRTSRRRVLAGRRHVPLTGPDVTHYDTLGVAPTPVRRRSATAYRQLARRLPPRPRARRRQGDGRAQRGLPGAAANRPAGPPTTRRCDPRSARPAPVPRPAAPGSAGSARPASAPPARQYPWKLLIGMFVAGVVVRARRRGAVRADAAAAAGRAARAGLVRRDRRQRGRPRGRLRRTERADRRRPRARRRAVPGRHRRPPRRAGARDGLPRTGTGRHDWSLRIDRNRVRGLRARTR